jgi:hypothetical protein
MTRSPVPFADEELARIDRGSSVDECAAEPIACRVQPVVRVRNLDVSEIVSARSKRKPTGADARRTDGDPQYTRVDRRSRKTARQANENVIAGVARRNSGIPVRRITPVTGRTASDPVSINCCGNRWENENGCNARRQNTWSIHFLGMEKRTSAVIGITVTG